MNRTKALELFEANAQLFGDRDGVTEQVGVELFGREAVDFARRMGDKDRRTIGGYGIGDFMAEYLTEYGFMIAATYCNVAQIRNRASQVV